LLFLLPFPSKSLSKRWSWEKGELESEGDREESQREKKPDPFSLYCSFFFPFFLLLFCSSFFSFCSILFWDRETRERERSRLRQRNQRREGEIVRERIRDREIERALEGEAESETQNPKETRPSDEPIPDFRQAEARLPMDHWPVVLGAISGGSVQKFGDFQGWFFGKISGGIRSFSREFL
jgi:hypothetical protein